jgi:hypothetical protein
MYYVRKIIIAAVWSAAALVPTVSFADNASPGPCLLGDHKVLSVAPYKVEGRYVYPGNGAHELRGAQIYLAAEPGLTAEWLQLTLERRLGAMKGQPPMPDCAFDVENLRVEVVPAGPGFWVRLIAPDEKTGEEVLRRARLLVA